MSEIRIFALGGLDEDGKNLTVVEVNEDIYIIDCGLKYPDNKGSLGVEYIIPDTRYIVENKDRVKAVFITHGHDDAMGALPYLLKEVNLPVYTTPLTARLLEKSLKEHKLNNVKVKVIKRNDTVKFGSLHVKTFGLTHSIADAFGLAIETRHGYIVYAGEYIIDLNAQNPAFACDITQLAEIGKKGVFAFMTESIGSNRSGYTAPQHRISEFVEDVLENTNKRVFVTMYEQNLYRLLELIELARKYRRKVFFYNPEQRELLRVVEGLGYYKLVLDLEVPRAKFNNDQENMMVIVSSSGPNVFKVMHKIAMREDELIQLKPSDTVVIASPVVPGTEHEAGAMENELYKEDVNVVIMDRKKVISMHASQEDIKMMMYLLKPRYFVPIHGEYQHLVANANLALDLGMFADKIIVLDNGQIATFSDGKLNNMANVLKLDEVLIDGKDHLDSSGLILKDREILSKDGVIVVGVVVDFKTKEVIGGHDVQSRGVIYLKDADHIVKETGNILERTINEMVRENRYDNTQARNESRDKMVRYIMKETGKRPMILPVIIEIDMSE